MTGATTQIILSLLAGIIAGLILYILRISRRATEAVIGGFLSAGLALVLTAWLVPSFSSSMKLKIVSPTDGDEVGFRTLVKGEVSLAHSKVYVLVHPLLINRWWVQSMPLVQNDGHWQTEAYIGDETAGVGESFEILAVAMTESSFSQLPRENQLAEGQQLEAIPPYFAKSNLIVIKRVR